MLSRKRLGWLIAFYGLLFGFIHTILSISIFGLLSISFSGICCSR
jgi:hypothetical protein